jgi:putative spermidine/putrescine transport system substrate-binding protein
MGAQWIYAINQVQGGSENDIQPGLDFVEKLIELDPVVVTSADHGLRVFQNGDVDIMPYWTARTDQIELESDITTEFIYPEEGALSLFWNLALVKGRPEEKTEAAADFISSSTLNTERQATFSENVGYPPTLSEATESISEEAVEKRPTLDITEEDMENLSQITIDWLTAANKRSNHSQQYSQVVES